MAIRIFNQLSFKRQTKTYSGELQSTVDMQAYVPGVNSGAYDKALHITINQKRPFKFNRWLKWKFGREEIMTANITLNIKEMESLRDEINKILRLPFE